MSSSAMMATRTARSFMQDGKLVGIVSEVTDGPEAGRWVVEWGCWKIEPWIADFADLDEACREIEKKLAGFRK
jgi:hypothetical protein